MKKRHLKSPAIAKKKLVQGSVVATIIAATPFMFNIYRSVPEKKVWDTFLFTYQSEVWQNVSLVAWIFIGKAIPILLLLIWFFTNKHWWYHVLIVPIIMYVHQIFGLFNDDQGYIDEFQLLYMIPIMAIIIPSIYLIRAKIFNRINESEKSFEELEDEFKLSPKKFWKRLNDYF